MQGIEVIVPDDRDSLITRLWELGTLGLVETSTRVEAFFEDDVDLSELARDYHVRPMSALPPSDLLPLVEADRDPIFAGDRFVIVSATSRIPLSPDRIPIVIDAQNAFGSGSHESTQLVIRALEQVLHPGVTVLDVGSGSGVISAVAQHLGANRVVACDTHLASAQLTRQHAPEAHVFAGSVDSLAPHSAEIVVANISARVVDTLAPYLHRITKPGGFLILAGFIADNPPQCFSPIVETEMNEWRCWICQPDLLKINFAAMEPLQPFPAEWW